MNIRYDKGTKQNLVNHKYRTKRKMETNVQSGAVSNENEMQAQ